MKIRLSTFSAFQLIHLSMVIQISLCIYGDENDSNSLQLSPDGGEYLSELAMTYQ